MPDRHYKMSALRTARPFGLLVSPVASTFQCVGTTGLTSRAKGPGLLLPPCSYRRVVVKLLCHSVQGKTLKSPCPRSPKEWSLPHFVPWVCTFWSKMSVFCAETRQNGMFQHGLALLRSRRSAAQTQKLEELQAMNDELYNSS